MRHRFRMEDFDVENGCVSNANVGGWFGQEARLRGAKLSIETERLKRLAAGCNASRDFWKKADLPVDTKLHNPHRMFKGMQVLTV